MSCVIVERFDRFIYKNEARDASGVGGMYMHVAELI